MTPAIEYGLVEPAARLAGRLVFAIALVGYFVTAGGSLTTTDAVVTFALTEQMVEHRSIALPRNMLGNEAHRGTDGRYYSPFGLAQSIYNIPFYLAGRGAELAGLRVGRPQSLRKAAVALGNTVAAAAAAWAAFTFAWRLSGSVGAAVFTALAIAFATPLWPYSGFGFNVPLSAWFVTAAISSAWASTRRQLRLGPLAAGMWLGLALLTRHELILAGVPIAWWFYVESDGGRRRAATLLTFVAGLLPFVVLWLCYNAVRFGSALDSGYLRDEVPRFGSSPLVGLYGLLLSPTASVVVYCPLIVAGIIALVVLRRRDAKTAALLAGTALGFLVFYSLFGNWMGGRSYGPRYLVPLLPLVIVPLAAILPARGVARRAVLCCVLLSGAAQLPGVFVDYAKISVAHARADGALTARDRLVSWPQAPIVRNLRAAVRAIPQNAAWLAGTTPRPAVPPATDDDFSQRFVFSLDFWWLYLFFMGVIGPLAAVAIPTGSLLLLMLLVTRLRHVTELVR